MAYTFLPTIPTVLQNVIIAVALGALIGLERESQQQRKYAGIRTLAILAAAGPIAVHLDIAWNSFVFTFLYILFAGILSLSIIAIRILKSKKEDVDIGLTTSATVFAVALSSVLIGNGQYFEAVAIGLVVALLLSEKQLFTRYTEKFSQGEITDALKFLFLALVLLPLTPDATFFHFFNPRIILLLVIFILSIEFASFVALRLYGMRGYQLAAFLGGMVSSTATVLTLAHHAEKTEDVRTATGGVVLATTASFLRILAIVALFSAALLSTLLPLFVTAGAFAILIFFIVTRNTEHDALDLALPSPFSFAAAFKFGGLFLLFLALIHYTQVFLGDTGFFLASLVGGAVSTTPVVASAVSLLNAGDISAAHAATGIVGAAAAGIIGKASLLRAANKELFRSAVIALFFMLFGLVVAYVLFL